MGGIFSDGVDFWIFWIFHVKQLNLDCQKNSNTKVEKTILFIFMSSCPEMSWPKQEKNS
jgi:hypothetical protein